MSLSNLHFLCTVKWYFFFFFKYIGVKLSTFEDACACAHVPWKGVLALRRSVVSDSLRPRGL